MRNKMVLLGAAAMASAAFTGTAQAANGNGNQGCPADFNYRNPGAFFQVVRDTTGQNPAQFARTAGFASPGEAIRVLCKEA